MQTDSSSQPLLPFTTRIGVSRDLFGPNLIQPTVWILGANLHGLGRLDAALEAANHALSISESIGDPRLQTCAGWTRAGLFAMQEDSEAGLTACQRVVVCAPDLRNAAIAQGF
jgi:hypothetical protein